MTLERSDWQDLVSRLVELVLADERRRMGSSQRGIYWRHEAWHKGLGLDKKVSEGSGYEDLPVPGTRVGRKEAWEEWVEDGDAQRTATQSHERSVSKHSRQQFEHMEWRTGVSGPGSQKKEASPRETRTTARMLGWKMRRKRWEKARRHYLRDNVCRMLQTPIRQGHQDLRFKMKVLRLIDDQ